MESFQTITEDGNPMDINVCGKCGGGNLRFERKPVDDDDPNGSAGWYVWMWCKDCKNESEKAIQGMRLHEELAIQNWNCEQEKIVKNKK